MAVTYYLIPVLFRRELIAPGLARIQPYLFGFAMYFFCLVMMGAGTLGVSRRHWDMAFNGNANTFWFAVALGVGASLIGFLYHNWHPSVMYMGDTGSQFLGVFWPGSA